MDVENGSFVGAETFKIETRTMVEHHKMGCSSYIGQNRLLFSILTFFINTVGNMVYFYQYKLIQYN